MSHTLAVHQTARLPFQTVIVFNGLYHDRRDEIPVACSVEYLLSQSAYLYSDLYDDVLVIK